MLKLGKASMKLLFGPDIRPDTEAGAREPIGKPVRFGDAGKAIELEVPRNEDPLFDKGRYSN